MKFLKFNIGKKRKQQSDLDNFCDDIAKELFDYRTKHGTISEKKYQEMTDKLFNTIDAGNIPKRKNK